MKRVALKSAAPLSHALLVLRVVVGVFLIVKSSSKVGWLFDSAPLATRLADWSARTDINALSAWYARLLLPGAAVFARLVVLGEMGGGLALIAGFSTRAVAVLAALMILNFHLATGELLASEFLSDANGLVVVASLVALAIGGHLLPWSVTSRVRTPSDDSA